MGVSTTGKMGNIPEKQVECLLHQLSNSKHTDDESEKTRMYNTAGKNMEESHSNFGAQNVLLNSLCKSESYKRKDWWIQLHTLNKDFCTAQVNIRKVRYKWLSGKTFCNSLMKTLLAASCLGRGGPVTRTDKISAFPCLTFYLVYNLCPPRVWRPLETTTKTKNWRTFEPSVFFWGI